MPLTASAPGRVRPAPSPPPPGRRAAKAVTEALAPLVMVAAQSAAVVAAAHPGWARGAAALLVALALGSLAPMVFLLWGVRGGRWLSHHVPAREHRLTPMSAVLACLLAGDLVLRALPGARGLTALFDATSLLLCVLIAITVSWKVSAHTAVVTSAVVTAVFLFGPVGACAAVLVPATVWSRTALRAHTMAQALAGTAVGALVTTGAYLLLARP